MAGPQAAEEAKHMMIWRRCLILLYHAYYEGDRVDEGWGSGGGTDLTADFGTARS